jgi:hypothetical protein
MSKPTFSGAVFTGCIVVAIACCAGCATSIKQHNIGCYDRSKADVLRSASALLIQNGFTITMADTIIGLVQAETAESRDIWSGTISKRVWQVNIKPELGKDVVAGASTAALTAPPGAKPMYIMATAKTVNRTQNAYGATLSTSEVYYDDSAHEDWEWYWDVRKGMEEMCGTKAVVTTKKVH